MPNSNNLKKQLLSKQLQESIKRILKEYEDYGDDYGGDYGGGYGGGSHYEVGKNTVLGKIFNPMLQVGKTALWGTQRLTTKLKNLVLSTAKGSAALLNPNLQRGDVQQAFDKIRDLENHELQHLDQKFQEVLKDNWAALKENDVWGLAFLLNPGALIAAKLVEKAPGVAFDLVDALTAGYATKLAHQLGHSAHRGHHARIRSGEEHYDRHGYGGERYHHDGIHDAQVVKDRRTRKALEQSPSVQKTRQAGLNIIVQRAKRIFQAKSFEELSQIAETTIDPKPFLNAAQGQPNATELALQQIKEQVKVNYLEMLENLKKNSPGAEQMIDSAIAQIRQLQ